MPSLTSMPWPALGVLSALGLPALALSFVGVGSALPRRPSERAITRVVASAFTGACLALCATGLHMLRTGLQDARVPLGDWFALGHYGFALVFVVDRLSLPLALLATVLVGLVAAFSTRYLHRERGFARFYLQLTLFGFGVLLTVLAGSLELILFGWELVGVTSALLIAYFDDRPAPVRHGLRAYMTYRACDIGLLAAVVWLHHTVASAAITRAPGQPWAGLVMPESSFHVTLVGLLLCWAAMGKAAQFPLGGWLPRAMEGPTPSSAIFYGALSIHLGPYLLLRAAPILEHAPPAAGAVVLVGALTLGHATFVGRVQTDIKSALAYASMAQVGLIFMEIGLGLRFIALIHIVGHASIRTLQLLRAPSLLHDHHHLEQAMGRALPRTGGHLERIVPSRLQPRLYRLALERGYLDSLLVDYLVGGARRCLRQVDRLEQSWTDLLGGQPAARRERSEATR